MLVLDATARWTSLPSFHFLIAQLSTPRHRARNPTNSNAYSARRILGTQDKHEAQTSTHAEQHSDHSRLKYYHIIQMDCQEHGQTHSPDRPPAGASAARVLCPPRTYLWLQSAPRPNFDCRGRWRGLERVRTASRLGF